jgi:hypothetical protein
MHGFSVTHPARSSRQVADGRAFPVMDMESQFPDGGPDDHI